MRIPPHTGVDHANDLFIRKTFKRTRQTIAGIIEDHIDSTAYDFIHRAFDLLWVGDIQWQQYNARPQSC